MRRTNAWKKISGSIDYRNKYFSVRKDRVIRPDKKEGDYYVICGIESVGIIAEEDDSIYLVGQTRYPLDNLYSWELPFGSIPKGRLPLKHSKTELKEETGLVASSWEKFGYFYAIPGIGTWKTHLFIARDLEKREKENEGTEDISVRKVKINEVKKMIKEGEIVCAFTLAALSRYFLSLES